MADQQVSPPAAPPRPGPPPPAAEQLNKCLASSVYGDAFNYQGIMPDILNQYIEYKYHLDWTKLPRGDGAIRNRIKSYLGDVAGAWGDGTVAIAKYAAGAGGYSSQTYLQVQDALDFPTTGAPKLYGLFRCQGDTNIKPIEVVGDQIVKEIMVNMVLELDDQPTDMALAAALEDANVPELNAANQRFNEVAQELGVALKEPWTMIGAAKDAFKEQCFLMSNVLDLAQKHKALQEETGLDVTKLGHKPLPTNTDPGACVLLDASNPFGFLNKLTQRPADAALSNLKTSQIASLQPKIRLFKIALPEDKDGNTNGAEEQTQEFIFDAHYGAGDEDGAGFTDIQRYLGDKNSRGQGVGIKDFTFTYEGDNPYAVKKSISATLTIFANSFDELLRLRRAEADTSDPDKTLPAYKFTDLALKTGGINPELRLGAAAGQDTTDNSGKLNFRLMAVVGWQKPPENISEDLRDAINDSYITLNLTPTIHTFKFDDAGRVTFTIEYLAYIEDLFDSPYFNIFGKIAGEGIDTKSLERKIKYKVLSEDCKYDEIDEMKNLDSELIDIEKQRIQARQSLIGAMFGRSPALHGVFNVSLPWVDLINYSSKGPFTVEWDATKNTTDLQLDLDLRSAVLKNAVARTAIGREFQGESRRAIRRGDSINVPFFYVSDLVDLVLKIINDSFDRRAAAAAKLIGKVPNVPSANPQVEIPVAEKDRWNRALEEELKNIERFKKEFNRFRLILGPLELYDHTRTKKYVINLGDIPVSMRYFASWLDDQMSPRDSVNYSLPRFLSDFFNQFIRSYINSADCYKGAIQQRVRLSQNVLTGYGDYQFKYGDKNTGVWAATRTTADRVVSYIAAANTQAAKKGEFVGIPSGINFRNPPPGGRAIQFAGRASIDNYKSETTPLLKTSGPTGDPRQFDPNLYNQYNYMIFYAGRVQPQEQLNGNKSEDEKKGIFHYAIGRDRGLTKKIDLQRTSTPGLTELRFEREGYDGLMQLRETYDATIRTFANVKAVPGVYVYIDPKGFAPSTWGHTETNTGVADFDLTRLGIGGYYMIKRSSHSFGAGYADSVLDAVWVAETHADGKSATAPLEGEVAPQSPMKCKIEPQS